MIDVSTTLQAILAEQMRFATVVAGMQRDVGDVITEQATQGALLRGGDGGQSLVVRMAINEQKMVQVTDNMADLKRSVEGRLDQLRDLMEKVRENGDEQIRDANQQRTQNLIQIVTWILGLIAMLFAAGVNLWKH